MAQPDFAHTHLECLTQGDLRFLIERFPQPSANYHELATALLEFPTTLESLLNSEYVYQEIKQGETLLLDVSPFLFFNVMLRRILDKPRGLIERQAINYLANLLCVFLATQRLQRVAPDDPQPFDHLVDLMGQAVCSDARRRFLIYAHIGNYSLYLTGFFADWLTHRHAHGRRPVSPNYYFNLGSSYYGQAASHPLAHEYRLHQVLLHLALGFERYRGALHTLAHTHLLH